MLLPVPMTFVPLFGNYALHKRICIHWIVLIQIADGDSDAHFGEGILSVGQGIGK